MAKEKFNERFNNISDLCNLDGRVYVEFASDDRWDNFVQRAEEEGFAFSNGSQPSSQQKARVIAVNKDKTLNYVGAIGMAAYGSNAPTIGGQKLIRIIY